MMGQRSQRDNLPMRPAGRQANAADWPMRPTGRCANQLTHQLTSLPFYQIQLVGSADLIGWTCATMDHDKAGRGAVQGDAKLTQQSKREGKGGSGLGHDE
jgi:hypothetical protein